MCLRAEAGGGQPLNPKHWPGSRPAPRSEPGSGSGPGRVEGPSIATPAPALPRGREGREARASAGAQGPDLAAASGGGEGPLEPEPALPSGPGPARRCRGVRSGPSGRGDGKVTRRRRPRRGAATSALPLASQSAQYLLSSSLSSLDRMSWCCSFSF